MPISDYCKIAGNCNEPACIQEILDYHSIDGTTFTELEKDFYREHTGDDTNLPTPLIKSRNDIASLIGTANCSNQHVVCHLDMEHLNTHSGMSLSIGTGNPPTGGNAYSISLFNGLLGMSAMHHLGLVRLNEKNTGQPSMGIIAYDVNDEEIFFGDLTNDFP